MILRHTRRQRTTIPGPLLPGQKRIEHLPDGVFITLVIWGFVLVAWVIIVPKDFGIGVGVIGHAVMSFKDEHGQGFDTPMFHMAVWEQCDEWLHKHVTVLLSDKVKGDKWDKDPMATHRKTLKGKK